MKDRRTRNGTGTRAHLALRPRSIPLSWTVKRAAETGKEREREREGGGGEEREEERGRGTAADGTRKGVNVQAVGMIMQKAAGTDAISKDPFDENC